LGEQGFTLVELMVTVAIIAILAAIAVPAFTKESRKSKATSEVGAMFSELAVRQDQYKLENNAYLTTAACPSAPASNGQDASACINSGGVWEPLRARLPQTKLACSYAITTGTGTGTSNPSGFSFTSPVTSWFYIIATCDMDGDGTNALYFTSSVDSSMQKQQDGE
jgi:prepilin-type N-terminal cleavage/methylation domain-containing protein